jgi:DNA-binding transcriptional ArsR family regulator
MFRNLATGQYLGMTATERYAPHAEFFAVLANPTRHALFHELCERAATVSSLAERLGVSRPNVSQHLAVLNSHGLVQRRRTGTNVLWAATEPRLARACALIEEVLGSGRNVRPSAIARDAGALFW